MTPTAHILVATDLTDRSERAMARALRLCSDARADRLTILHVIAAGLPPTLADQQRGAAQAHLRSWISRQAAEGVGPTIDSVITTGVPFGTIIDESIYRKADLVVIGAPGRHRYSQVFVGTTAELVIRFADRPVLMVNEQTCDSYRNVVAAFDASEGSVRALHMALAIAPAAQIRVIHGWRPPHASFGELDATRDMIDQENTHLKALIHEAARDAVTSACSEPADVIIELIEGNPYQVVANGCSSADLVAMGTHSKGRLASTVSIGRLAGHLLVECACDVLTSRP